MAQIQTHKVVLTPPCPFFMEMLKKRKHPHPMIYMKGSKAAELLAMVDFFYYGEANVTQECLDVFLGLAEELKLKGLTGSSVESSTEESRNKATAASGKNREESKRHIKTTANTAKPSSLRNLSVKTESPPVALVSVEAHHLDEQIKSMMIMTENEIIVGKYKQKAYACILCEKEGYSTNIKAHIEAKHIESNITHSCDICGKISKSRFSLRKHKTKQHFKQTGQELV